MPLRKSNQAAPTGKQAANTGKQAGNKAGNKAHVRRSTQSARYTPPAPKKKKQSKLWLPATMFTCLVLGVIVLAGNYMELLPGGEVSNNNLLIGLTLLISGFVLSTFYR